MKNKFRIIVSFLLVLVMVMSFCSCGNSGDEVSSDETVDNISDVGTSDSTSSETDASSSTNSPLRPGSGGSNSTTQGNSGTTGNTGAEWKAMLAKMPAELKGTTITIYDWNPISDYTGAAQVVEKFTKETGIKVKWITGSYDNYPTEVSGRIAAKKSPDVIRLGSGPEYRFLSLTQPLSVSGFDYSGSAWDKEVAKLYTVNGKQYAAAIKNTLFQDTKVYYYNRSYISQYNLQDPYQLYKKGKWTWSAFTDMCKQFNKVSGKIGVVWAYVQDYHSQIGVQHTYWDGTKYVNNMKNSKIVDAWKVVMPFISDGLSTKTYYDESVFSTGNALFNVNGYHGMRKSDHHFKDMKAVGNLGVVPPPTVEGVKNYISSAFEARAICKGAQNPKAVPYFLYYFLNAENYDENSMFFDKTSLEVYKYCRDYKDKICVPDLLGKANIEELVKLPVDQMPGFLDRKYNTVKAAVDDENAKLATLK